MSENNKRKRASHGVNQPKSNNFLSRLIPLSLPQPPITLISAINVSSFLCCQTFIIIVHFKIDIEICCTPQPTRKDEEGKREMAAKKTVEAM